MYYPGIVSYSGMAVGRSGFLTGPAAPFTRAAQTTRISEVQAENKRHVRDLLVDRGRSAPAAAGAEQLSQAEIPLPHGHAQGRAVLSFLAQHIAQEVSPEVAGPDRYVTAAEAYIGARDFNAEMLPQGAGLDIRI